MSMHRHRRDALRHAAEGNDFALVQATIYVGDTLARVADALEARPEAPAPHFEAIHAPTLGGEDRYVGLGLDTGGDHCTLVNPLCPSDLCGLKANHTGHHRLGTMGEETYEVSDVMFLATYGTPKDELVRLGARKARGLWPEDG